MLKFLRNIWELLCGVFMTSDREATITIKSVKDNNPSIYVEEDPVPTADKDAIAARNHIRVTIEMSLENGSISRKALKQLMDMKREHKLTWSQLGYKRHVLAVLKRIER